MALKAPFVSSRSNPKEAGMAKVKPIFITHMHRESSYYVPSHGQLHHASQRTTSWAFPLFNILGFPHPEALSSRGTPVNTFPVCMCDRFAALMSLQHTAEDQFVRPSGPPHLPPHRPLADAHQNRRPLRGPQAPHAYGPTHTMRRRSIVR